MRMLHAIAVLVLPFIVSTAARSQSTWDKTYNVSGKAALSVEVDDASVRVTACGGCRTVHIHVDGKGNDLSKFRITEMQGGDGIHFGLKQPEMRGFLTTGWNHRSPEVTIETPAETQLTARGGDGSLSVAGVRGGSELHTGDGSIQMTDVSGALRATTGDGSVGIHRAEGTLFATTGDGAMMMEGRFSQVQARAGDGSIHMSLLPGSKLTASSHITTGDGSIVLEVSRDLQVEVQATTGDGHIANSLPLAIQSSNAKNSLHGTMNGGGTTLRLQSGDGSIVLSAH